MARRFTELVCWQLARELHREVIQLTQRKAVNDNFDLRDQLRDAAASVRRNIAEGFGRAGHREFARFLNISLASINEVEDALLQCLDHGYLQEVDIQAAQRLCRRTTSATSRLRTYLTDKQ